MLSFFMAAFVSILWLIGAVFFISVRLANVMLSAIGINELAVYMAIILFPLFIIWFLWGQFCSFRQQMLLQKQLNKMSEQIRLNQEYSDVIARAITKGEQQQAHAFALGKIDIYIRETNEILADILQRYHLLNEKNMLKIWEMANRGNHWGFARAFVDLRNSIPDFEDKIAVAAKKEKLLAGGMTEFCVRYSKLLHLLKEHDEDNIIQEIIETGVYGRVFTIFAPIVQKLQEKAEEPEDITDDSEQVDAVVLTEEECFFKDNFEDKSDDNKTDMMVDAKENIETMPDIIMPQSDLNVEKTEKISGSKKSKKERKAKKPFWNKFVKEPEEEDEDSQIDPLTLALRRSFGAAENNKTANKVPEQKRENPDIISSTEKTEQHEEVSSNTENTVSDNNRFAFSNTNEVIKNLQKEWEEMKMSDIISPKNDEESEEKKDE